MEIVQEELENQKFSKCVKYRSSPNLTIIDFARNKNNYFKSRFLSLLSFQIRPKWSGWREPFFCIGYSVWCREWNLVRKSSTFGYCWG